jgi:hypothetical protein
MEFGDLNTKFIEAEAFQAGTQGVESEAQLREIDAGFTGLKQRVIQETTERLRSLEAAIANLKRRVEEAQDQWSDLQMRTDGMPPAIVLPLVGVCLALLVVTGEAVFLAPVMDALGLADPIAQLVFAGVIVVVTSGLIEITKRQLLSHAEPVSDHVTREETSQQSRSARYLKIVMLVSLSVLSLTLVFFLGRWRAEQMIFAASLQHAGAWKQFMASNPDLTRAVVVLLTTGLPIFVAVVFDWGLNGLQLAWEWRKARHQCHKFSRQLGQTEKKLEAETEAKESRLAELDEKCNEWKNSYEHHHALGKQIGAWKTPLWRVVVRIAAVCFVMVAICFLLDPYVSEYIFSVPARLFIYALLALGLSGLYAAHVIKAWDRPNAKQLFEQRKTVWRDESDRTITAGNAAREKRGLAAAPELKHEDVNGSRQSPPGVEATLSAHA